MAMGFYLPSTRITQALADSRPVYVPKNMFGSERRKKIRYRSLKWIAKAKQVMRRSNDR